MIKHTNRHLYLKLIALNFVLVYLTPSFPIWSEADVPPAERSILPKAGGTLANNQDKDTSMPKWFIEGFGQYGYLQAFVSPNPDNSFDSLTYSGKVNYQYPNTSGYTVGAHLGYTFLKNLSVFAGYQFRTFSWLTRSYFNATGAGPSSIYYGTSEGKSTLSSNVLIVGIRPHFDALGGRIYASLGFAAILPFSITNTSDTRFITSSFSTASTFKSENDNRYNLSPALILDFGYQYPISSQVYVSMSLVVLVTASTNNGKTTEAKTIYPDGRSSTSTTTYVDSYSLSDLDKSYGSQGAYIARYSVIFPNDIGIRISVGYRLGL